MQLEVQLQYISDHIWPWDHNLTPISSMFSSVKWNYQPFLPLVDGIAWNNCNLEWFKSNQVIGFVTDDVLFKDFWDIKFLVFLEFHFLDFSASEFKVWIPIMSQGQNLLRRLM